MRSARRIEPPLRRWAARRLLGGAPSRLSELLAVAQRLDPQGSGALILGLLDASAALPESERRRLMAVYVSECEALGGVAPGVWARSITTAVRIRLITADSVTIE
ncbi:MAG: hypothetical protein ACYCVV_20120 [Acidimicrobiales bacterium]